MHPIRVVLGKELKDASRDRRSLMSAFMFPFLAPLMVFFMLTLMIDLSTTTEKKPIAVIGLEFAPDFSQWMAERDYNLEALEGDPKQAVRNKDVELVLVIPDDFERKIAASKPASIVVVNDSSRNDTRASVREIRGLIRDYNQGLASLRLMARGLDPRTVSVVTAEDRDVASKEERSATALNFILIWVILAAFAAGMGIAVDASAGERERKSLEPLLINPILHHHLVMGKWMGASMFAVLGQTLTLVLSIIATQFVALDKIGLEIDANLLKVLLMLAICLPLCFLATSLQLLIGMFAKSFKDAQSYIGLLMLVPMLPVIYLSIDPVTPQDWMYVFPIMGQHLFLVDVLGGKSISAVNYLLSTSVCLVLSLGFVMITARLFRRESIING